MPVAIVTGASSGIGKGTALLFAEKGYNVCITSRTQDALESVRQTAIERGARNDQILIVTGDLHDESTAREIVKKTFETFGRIDSLVNCAGILVGGPVIECPLKDFDRVFDVNVRSLIQLTQLALPHIIEVKGTVVNVSSIAGPCPFPGISYYCMSKAAIDQFTKCLALEMARHGVRVNAVCPGAIITEIHKRAGQSDEQYQLFLQKCKLTHALGRAGTVEEVSKAILFLAGPDSSFTTGDLLKIDGGRGIMHPSATQVTIPEKVEEKKSACESCKSCIKVSSEVRSSA
ncbi:hypothetical protein PFISCL1PPCAC_18264 [Pristionchus fissidentatus]|uniref:Dehydrogenase n=1 Tax=Pristionchus fissidentatus TaxID=1538716 RepID=A0AAV5WAC2_9BILA|nr:hypothetical protein PFISCL1PPCAC_18264 [Pristionchus fissidentatus]